MAKERSEMEQLFEDSRNRFEALGYTLEPIEGTQMQYTIKDDAFTYGELLAGIDNDMVVNVMVNNYGTGEFTDIGSMADIQNSVDKFFAYKEFNTPAPEAVDISFMEFINQLERKGYELNPLGDEGKSFIVRYKNENLGAFDRQADGNIGLLTMGDYQLIKSISPDTAFLHFEGLAAIRDEQEVAAENEKEMESEINEGTTPLDEFVNANKAGFYVHVGDDEKGPVAFGLDGEEIRKYVEDHGIEASSTGEYADKMAHSLMEEYENTKENIVDTAVEKAELEKEEKEIMQELNITPEMTEKQMAEAVIDYVNDGREADEEQKEWINSHNDVEVRKESDIRREELKGIRSEMGGLEIDIQNDRETLADLNKQLDRQLSIAKINGCGEQELENIKNIVNQIKDTTNDLNENRAVMAGLEEQEKLKIKELNEAVRYERTEKIKGVFEKVQDTLKKGVTLGIGALSKIRDGIEKANLKAMEKTTLKERVEQYKDLAREVHEINRDYVNEMQYLKSELERNTNELEKVTQQAERAAQIRGTLKDLGRLLTGKEALHDYSRSEADEAHINALKESIEDTKEEMQRVDTAYDRKVAPKQQELKDWGKGLEEKGKSPADLFNSKIQDAMARAADNAKATHEGQAANKEAR